MLDRLKKVGQQTIIYGLGSIISKLLGFILIPVYINYITISDFGNLTIYEISIQFLAVLLTFGINSAHQRYFYQEKQKGTYGIFLFNNFFGNLFLILIALSPFLLFTETFSMLLFGTREESFYLQLTLWIVPCEILFNLIIQIFQYEKKPFLFLFYNSLKLLISLALTIYFVIAHSMGIEGILWARLIGAVVILLILTLTVVVPRCTFRINLSYIIQSIKFGLPLIISSIGSMIFLLSDRYMLNILSTDAEVGKYGFGLKIANFINLIFIQTVGLSYLPSVMDSEENKNNLRYYRKMLTYYCFLIGFIILGFLFTYREILSLVVKNKEYWDGLNVVPLLCLSFMIMGMNYFVGIGLFLTKKTNYYLIPAFIAACLNIGLNFKLIPLYGMMGAGYSVIIAQVFYTAILAYLSGLQLKIGYEWGKILLIYILSIALYFAGLYLTFTPVLLSLFFKFGLILFLPIILYKLKFYEQIEIDRLKTGFFKWYKNFKALFS